jgi:hypothetical protein
VIPQHPHTEADGRQFTRQLIWLLVMAAIAGGTNACIPYRVEYMEDALQQATQAELVHKFGYPQRLKRLKNGDQVWEYDFQGEERKCVTYAIMFNPEHTLRQWERRDCQKEPPPSRSRK